MRGLFLLAAAGLSIAAPAMAQNDLAPKQPPLPSVSTIDSNNYVLVVPGRRISLTFDDKMTPKNAGEGAADDLGFPLPENDPQIETWAQHTGDARVDPGALRINLYAFTPKPGSQQPATVLEVANGRDKPVVYFAALVMGVEGKHVIRYTTICSIKPHGVGLESFGESVEGILVLKVVETDGPICSDARTGKFYPVGQQPPPPDPPAPKPN